MQRILLFQGVGVMKSISSTNVIVMVAVITAVVVAALILALAVVLCRLDKCSKER